jgi:hypothetical protein
MSRRLIGLFVVILILASFLVVGPVSAHEQRQVGDYVLELGWRVEPVYTGLFNGPEIIISRGTASDEEVGEDQQDPADMVAGAEETLQLEVTFGPSSKILKLRPVPDEPGHYTADLIPTRPGDYSFHVTGMIEDTPVDETFTSADGKFGTVEPIEDIQFP